MRNQSDDINKLNSEYLPEKARKVYQPPMLTLLDKSKPESGGTNVPETNSGLLES